MQLRMKNLNIFGVHWAIQLLGQGGGGSQKAHIEGDCLKRGEDFDSLVWQFKRGLGKKEGSGVFEGVLYLNAHYGDFAIYIVVL